MNTPQALIPVLDTFDRPPIVLGHSFGGRVAIQLAAARPHAIQALILTGVPQLIARPKPKPNKTYRLIKALHRYRVVSDG